MNMAERNDLIWKGHVLWRKVGDSAKLVGSVRPSTLNDGCWDVIIRGNRKHTISSEVNARKQLEAYAD